MEPVSVAVVVDMGVGGSEFSSVKGVIGDWKADESALAVNALLLAVRGDDADEGPVAERSIPLGRYLVVLGASGVRCSFATWMLSEVTPCKCGEVALRCGNLRCAAAGSLGKLLFRSGAMLSNP